MSTDAAHSLADAYGLSGAGSDPVEVEPGLWVQQVDTQRELERSWSEVSGYLRAVLDAAGVDHLTAEELTVVPGLEEVLALLELRAHVRQQHRSGGGPWDVVVVDCAPTAETLRLLALPEALRWYLDRVGGPERRLLKALRPVVGRATGLPVPGDEVISAVERLQADLLEVRRLLVRPESSVRLVLTPERVVLAEARRSLTTLSLLGYRVDGVVANRVFPAGAGAWADGWQAAQAEVLAEVHDSFAPLPVWTSSYAAAEPVGPDAVASVAQDAYASRGTEDPFAVPEGPGPVRVRRLGATGPGERRGAELRVSLPFVATGDVDLARHGESLVVTVGAYRRVLTLPASLARWPVSGATVDDGVLRVRFREAAAAAAAEDDVPEQGEEQPW
ncbi:arsenic-transporting ATPase [Marmoricola endophyticus]|uniref:Arsenic-transporting ATPase n=2 Tax=Marmoricola endophyticus TaxID=2040280 RepID=A0A917B9L7_9ACTN|nr:arsenic-transporting ATPase [Marmoricola endophyticus]